jgi:hypothetical protein
MVQDKKGRLQISWLLSQRIASGFLNQSMALASACVPRQLEKAPVHPSPHEADPMVQIQGIGHGTMKF